MSGDMPKIPHVLTIPSCGSWNLQGIVPGSSLSEGLGEQGELV